MFVVSCLLIVVCCLLFDVCCLLCCLVFVVCCVLFGHHRRRRCPSSWSSLFVVAVDLLFLIGLFLTHDLRLPKDPHVLFCYRAGRNPQGLLLVLCSKTNIEFLSTCSRSVAMVCFWNLNQVVTTPNYLDRCTKQNFSFMQKLRG